MMTQQLTVTMEQQDYDASRFMTHWLKAWKIGERLPEAANREEITDLQRLHHEWLQPVTAETFAVIFDKFWRFGSVYQLNGMGKHATNEGAVVKEATKFYFEAMQHLPADLVALAVDRVVKTWTYKKLPTPANVLALVDDEHAERSFIASRHRIVLQEMDRIDRLQYRGRDVS